MSSRFLRRARTLGLLAVLSAAAATHAAQTVSLAFEAYSLVSRVTFSFGNNSWIDEFTPVQTGLVSSRLLHVDAGVAALLGASPTASASFTYDPAGMTPYAGNSVMQAFLGGTSLTINLPSGAAGSPLTFSNAAGGFALATLSNNALLLPTGDGLVTQPGSADFASLAMAGGHQGAGLALDNGPPHVVKLDLLADPLFVATYGDPVPLPAIPTLVVTLQLPSIMHLSAPSIAFGDSRGLALSSLVPPAELPLQAFDVVTLSLPFESQGPLQLTLDAADYGSAADFAAAQSWLAAATADSFGFVSVGFHQTATWLLAAAVPEPGTWALWLAGLAAIGARACRRRCA